MEDYAKELSRTSPLKKFDPMGEKSVFAPMQARNDSKSLYDTPKVHKKGWAKDWPRINIPRVMGKCPSEEARQIGDLLWEWYSKLSDMFEFQSSLFNGNGILKLNGSTQFAPNTASS